MNLKGKTYIPEAGVFVSDRHAPRRKAYSAELKMLADKVNARRHDGGCHKTYMPLPVGEMK